MSGKIVPPHWGFVSGPEVFGMFFGGGLLQLASFITLTIQNLYSLVNGLIGASNAQNTSQGMFRATFSIGAFLLGNYGLGKVQYRPSPYFSYKGTPVRANGAGERISIWGEGEARGEGFLDYATRPNAAAGRPLTSEIADGAVSDLCLRDAPIDALTVTEIQRITTKGSRLTFSWATEGWETMVGKITSAFPDAKVVDTGFAVEEATGTKRGVIVIER